MHAPGPVSSTTAVSAIRRTSGRFCSTSSTVSARRPGPSTSADLGDQLGRQALRRLVDQQQPVSGRAAPGPARPSAAGRRTACRPAACAGHAVPGTARGPCRSRGCDAAASASRRFSSTVSAGEHVPVLRHVADPATGRCRWVGVPSMPSPSNSIRPGGGDETEDRLEGGGLADAVASEQGGHARRRARRSRCPAGCVTRRSGPGRAGQLDGRAPAVGPSSQRITQVGPLDRLVGHHLGRRNRPPAAGRGAARRSGRPARGPHACGARPCRR